MGGKGKLSMRKRGITCLGSNPMSMGKGAKEGYPLQDCELNSSDERTTYKFSNNPGIILLYLRSQEPLTRIECLEQYYRS